MALTTITAQLKPNTFQFILNSQKVGNGLRAALVIPSYHPHFITMCNQIINNWLSLIPYKALVLKRNYPKWFFVDCKHHRRLSLIGELVHVVFQNLRWSDAGLFEKLSVPGMEHGYRGSWDGELGRYAFSLLVAEPVCLVRCPRGPIFTYGFAKWMLGV